MGRAVRKHEARAAAQVRHRNLVEVIEAGEHDGRSYLVMPFLGGSTVAQRLERKGVLSVPHTNRLVAEVGLGRVGLVLGLEVSRLARRSSDWHRLLEICAMTGTLILDEDGLYDPATFNDRLLLGLKGTMSEAELYMIRARLHGGLLNKARRAALKLHLPIGFCYTERDVVVLDPDRQVQETIRFLFHTFQRTGSAR